MNETKSPSQMAALTRPRRATMVDVAKLARVSVMTVSRVMNATGPVSSKTRKQVAQAIAALNFAPSKAARVLAGCHEIRIGFLYSNANVGYLADFLLGLIEQASIYNAQPYIAHCELDRDVYAKCADLIDRGIDGIVLAPELDAFKAVPSELVGNNFPTVHVGGDTFDSTIDTVTVDDFEAAYRMTEHIASLGHRRIGFISGDPKQSSSAIRLAGYKAAIAALGADVSPQLVAAGAYTYRSGLEGAEYLLSLSPPPTAIFASNDEMAAAVVDVAQRRGLSVPGDLTVTGFDDVPLATMIWPSLTTISRPIKAIAHEAVNLIVRKVRAKDAGTVIGPKHVRMASELIRRQSDAAPRIRPNN